MENKELRITAELAHLYLDDAEIERFSRSVSRMLDYIGAIGKLDVSEYDNAANQPQNMVLREDRVEDTKRGNLVENADEHEDGFIILPNIL